MNSSLLSSMLRKYVTFVSLGLIIALTISTIIHQPSYASNSTFVCEMHQGIPTTFVKTSHGKKLPLIRWTSSYFPKLTPLNRCRQVSYKFQKSFDNGTLKTITTGTVNKYPVVCAVVSTNDVCNSTNVLFTLKPGTNAKKVVENLLDKRALAAGKIQNQSSDDTLYIDFDIYLNSLSAEP
ncbi:MAG: COP23 domain-containing protein [Gloeotrichia echinulata IR180]